MKYLALLTTFLLACEPFTVGGTTDWERAANGPCYDVVIVNHPISEPMRCPNRRHFAPSEVDRGASPDGGLVVKFICVCER